MFELKDNFIAGEINVKIVLIGAYESRKRISTNKLSTKYPAPLMDCNFDCRRKATKHQRMI